jgi:hypothetical protein
MSHPTVARSVPALKSVLGRSRFAVPFIVYSAFAAIVYFVQGAEPPLNIDHISYIKLTNEIRSAYPVGDYWRSFNSVRVYGVILAYAYDLTGSHLVSFKLVLAALTVAYLWAFQLLMGLATESRARAMLFSLFSALYVSFGASIWGMTDFAASLSRTVIIPFIVLLVWFFFRHFSSPWRYAVYPALILLSLLHLSALHVFLVFGAFELLDYIFRRRCRIDRNLAYFALSLVASALTIPVVDDISGGQAGYVRDTLKMAVSSVAHPLPPPGSSAPAPPAAVAPTAAPPPAVAPTPATPGSAVPPPLPEKPLGKPLEKLSSKEAWKIELLAFPWRNFPPSFATLATIALSFGVIFLLAAAGAVRAFRSGMAKPLDREMVTFAIAVPLAAYGLQILLWALRDSIPVFPVNFEEVRAINMVMIPSVYFIFRLYELAPEPGGLSQGAVRTAIMAAFALQPIVLVRAMPAPWREGVIHAAVSRGVLKGGDAPRMLYARQLLGLGDDGPRFYYSSRSAVDWLERNAGPDDLVLTNLNEFHMSRVKTVGPFLGILSFYVWEVQRAAWAESLEAIDRALATRNLGQVMTLARSLGATYAVVNWPVEGAAYRDDYYSVVRVQ